MATKTRQTTVYGCGNKTTITKVKQKNGSIKTKYKTVNGVKPRKLKK